MQLKRLLKNAFYAVYPVSKIAVDEEANRNLVANDATYFSQPLVLFAAFLGLPCLKRESETFTFLDLLKNMHDLSISKNKTDKLPLIDKVLALPMFWYHVINALLFLPINILKLATELFPRFSQEACDMGMFKAEKALHSRKLFLASTGYVFFSLWHVIGRAITSPIKGMLSGPKMLINWQSLLLSGLFYVFFVPPLLALAISSVAVVVGVTTITVASLFSSLGFASAILGFYFSAFLLEGMRIKYQGDVIKSLIRKPKAEGTVEPVNVDSTTLVYKNLPILTAPKTPLFPGNDSIAYVPEIHISSKKRRELRDSTESRSFRSPLRVG